MRFHLKEPILTELMAPDVSDSWFLAKRYRAERQCQRPAWAPQEERAAAQEAKRLEAEQEAQEEAARQLRQAKKQQSPAGPFPASFIPHKTAQCPSVLAWQQDNSVAPQCSWPLSALMRMR